MKFLVYGSSGWIGSQFIRLVNSGYVLIKGKSRLHDISAVETELTNNQPTHVFCFTEQIHGSIDVNFYSTIDYLEEPGKPVDNLKDNLFSPFVLAKLCEKLSIHLTCIGTGYIFKDDEEHPQSLEINEFGEEPKPNFFGSIYSAFNGFTDQLTTLFPNNVLNLRIHMAITEELNSSNFMTKITKYEKICSIPNSMTVLPELLSVALELAKRKHTGAFNLTNPGLLKEIADPDFSWENLTEEAQDQILADNRSKNFMDTLKFEHMLPKVKHIKDSVRQILDDYKGYHFPKKPFLTKTKPKSLNSDFLDKAETTLLISGGCGFIGSNFINTIMTRFNYINVINIDAMYYCANEENVDSKWRKSDRYTLIKGNICSIDFIRHVLETFKPTHIIHFAAQSHVQNSFTDALQYTKDNIVGTHTFLEACRLYAKKLQKFVHVSTDEVYGESMLSLAEEHKSEHSILCPTNPYAATKAGAELIAQSYFHSFKMPIVVTRGNNVYGPKQYPEKVIPLFIKQLQDGKPVTIQGDGSCLRAFLHIDDASNAFQCILERGKQGEIYNIGCEKGMEYSILEVGKILIRKIHKTENYGKWISYIEDRPFNDKRYYISNEKLKGLGWHITTNLENGLEKLLELSTNN